MKCPKCGKTMTKDFCIVCGYMLNGNYINKTNHEASDLSKALGNDYDKIIRNENKFLIFLLGPLYFSYRNYFFLGIILDLLNHYTYYLIATFSSNIFQYSIASKIIIFFYFLFNKLFWITISNPLYSFLIKRKIERIKNKHPNNKDEYILNIRIRNIYKLILTIFLYITIPLIIFIIYQNTK